MSYAIDQLKKIDLDKVLNNDLNEVGTYLVEEIGLFKTEQDLKLFLLEAAADAVFERLSRFPIHYEEITGNSYKDYISADEDEEEIPALTDEYIKENF